MCILRHLQAHTPTKMCDRYRVYSHLCTYHSIYLRALQLPSPHSLHIHLKLYLTPSSTSSSPRSAADLFGIPSSLSQFPHLPTRFQTVSHTCDAAYRCFSFEPSHPGPVPCPMFIVVQLSVAQSAVARASQLSFDLEQTFRELLSRRGQNRDDDLPQSEFNPHQSFGPTTTHSGLIRSCPGRSVQTVNGRISHFSAGMPFPTTHPTNSNTISFPPCLQDGPLVNFSLRVVRPSQNGSCDSERGFPTRAVAAVRLGVLGRSPAGQGSTVLTSDKSVARLGRGPFPSQQRSQASKLHPRSRPPSSGTYILTCFQLSDGEPSPARLNLKSPTSGSLTQERAGA